MLVALRPFPMIQTVQRSMARCEPIAPIAPLATATNSLGPKSRADRGTRELEEEIRGDLGFEAEVEKVSQDEVQSPGTVERALAGADGPLEATVSCVTN